MELTPEDRQRIYEEEKARIEARQELQKGRVTFGKAVGYTCFGIVVLICLLASLPSNGPVAQVDGRTAVTAYHAASNDFVRKWINRYDRAPNIAAYSPEKVAQLAGDRYRVDLTYEGRDTMGRPKADQVTYDIRCSDGLCMVREGPIGISFKY